MSEKRYGIEAVIDQSPAMQRALAQARAEGWRAGQEAMRQQAMAEMDRRYEISIGNVAMTYAQALAAIRALPLEPGAGHE